MAIWSLEATGAREAKHGNHDLVGSPPILTFSLVSPKERKNGAHPEKICVCEDNPLLGWLHWETKEKQLHNVRGSDSHKTNQHAPAKGNHLQIGGIQTTIGNLFCQRLRSIGRHFLLGCDVSLKPSESRHTGIDRLQPRQLHCSKPGIEAWPPFGRKSNEYGSQ